jgi:hypothetical protein
MMFKVGDIVMRKNGVFKFPQNLFKVIIVDNDWNMDIILISRSDNFTTIGPTYRVAQTEFKYETNYGRRLKLNKLVYKIAKN